MSLIAFRLCCNEFADMTMPFDWSTCRGHLTPSKISSKTTNSDTVATVEVSRSKRSCRSSASSDHPSALEKVSAGGRFCF
jgi:hypothetical protein